MRTAALLTCLALAFSPIFAQDIVIEKNQLALTDPIRELGVFKLPVKLHPEVTATLKLWVVEE